MPVSTAEKRAARRAKKEERKARTLAKRKVAVDRVERHLYQDAADNDALSTLPEHMKLAPGQITNTNQKEAAMKITKEWLRAHKTPNGGWTKAQLAAIGFRWEDKSCGWVDRLVGKEITDQQAEAFIAAATTYTRSTLEMKQNRERKAKARK
jgi:hypothetical protein